MVAVVIDCLNILYRLIRLDLNMDKGNDIKKFWDDQAKLHRSSYLATMPDYFLRKLELENIQRLLVQGSYVADIGCGNGYSTIHYAQAMDINIYGLDYSEVMIAMAQQALLKLPEEVQKKISFQIGDVRHTGMESEFFNTVITDRCLINLPTPSDQSKAIHEIYRLLKDNGLYLMCEDSAQGLQNLNVIRQYVGLQAIETRWHNLYIDEGHINETIKGMFTVEKIINFSSFYYLASRVINAKISQEQGIEPSYDSEINRVAAMCSSLSCFGDFGPLKLFVLRKNAIKEKNFSGLKLP